jgi:hypothetical protein
MQSKQQHKQHPACLPSEQNPDLTIPDIVQLPFAHYYSEVADKAVHSLVASLAVVVHTAVRVLDRVALLDIALQVVLDRVALLDIALQEEDQAEEDRRVGY